MTNVIIIHATNDKYFVNLLTALLEYHYIKTQCYSPDLQTDNELPEEFNAYIILISNNYLKSKLSGKEEEFFKTKKTDIKIIPLILDSINLKKVKYDYQDYQPIDFTECMLTGFKKLFSILGKEFLPYQERRIHKERRSEVNQRETANRRESDLLQRMRTGFWKSYSLATGLSEYAELIFGFQQLSNLKDSLIDEASKYKYLDNDGKSCDVEQVLEKSINNVWSVMSNRYYTNPANLVDYIINDIIKRYKVEPIDQRILSNRRTGIERRKNYSPKNKNDEQESLS